GRPKCTGGHEASAKPVTEASSQASAVRNARVLVKESSSIERSFRPMNPRSCSPRMLSRLFFVVFCVGCIILPQSCGSKSGKPKQPAGTQTQPAPGVLQVRAVSPTQIDVQWEPIKAAVAYALQKRQGDDQFLTVTLMPAEQTSYSDSGLLPDRPYRYRLLTRDANG